MSQLRAETPFQPDSLRVSVGAGFHFGQPGATRTSRLTRWIRGLKGPFLLFGPELSVDSDVAPAWLK